MNAEVDTETTRRETAQDASQRRRSGTAPRRSRPMPRSTTRVIWTMSQGTLVHFGAIS